MRTELECLPCFMRQISRTLGYAGVNGDRGRDITRRAETIIEHASFDQAPARVSTLLHRLMRAESGVDPYAQLKDEYNRIALEKLPAARLLARELGADHLAGSVRAAIAGNVIDFGIYDTVDLDRALRDSFHLPLPEKACAEFSLAVRDSRTILYLCDNAGEIVFDRVLIETLRSMGKKVIAAVKGAPVINDATLDDARSAGLLDSASQVIDNGSDGIGTLLEQCSEPFREAYRTADLIISKGQANYETLVDERDPRTFFLFMVKCPVVAKALGREQGDIILMSNR
ncbi:MAG: damage-control phosphatase ARMT1 family protein [Nitrospirota bacterium]